MHLENIDTIFRDFQQALFWLARKKTIVWPADGIGTGLARLPEKAPLTFKFIEDLVSSLKIAYGVVGEKDGPV